MRIKNVATGTEASTTESNGAALLRSKQWVQIPEPEKKTTARRSTKAKATSN